MSTDKLAQALWPDGVNDGKKDPEDEDRLAESLQKALDKTTPERAGCPWDGEHTDERRGEQGHIIREGN
jgi:hypothetical protein